MGHKKRAIRAEVARVLGVSGTAVGKFQHDPTFPEFDAKGEAEIYAVCVWWYLRKEAQPVPGDPEMLAGTESDGLERYRLARAQQEEIKLAEQRGQIVKLTDFEETVQAILGPYRRFAEHLKRVSGSDLWSMLEEANAEVLQGLERLNNAHGDTPASDPVGPVREAVGPGTP
jgi:phage terminase Nu1 subunit (DNA packaging protein)